MYKIYINDTPLFLASSQAAGGRPRPDSQHMVARYAGHPKLLLSYVDMLEKNARFASLTLYSDQPEQLFEDFSRQFRVLDAAGGVVYNPEGKILLILRRGYWDLPKGKIDKGESREDAALREVAEETGLQSARLKDYLGITYHTYRDKKKRRILKRTYWYRMEAVQQELIPQAEEDIERAEWLDPRQLLDAGQPMYGNIRDLLQKEIEA